MGEFAQFVWVGIALLVGGALVASILVVSVAVLVYLAVIRKWNQAYFSAYQEYLEQKNRVEKRLQLFKDGQITLGE